jgi:hypothetical protein
MQMTKDASFKQPVSSEMSAHPKTLAEDQIQIAVSDALAASQFGGF